MTKRQKEILKDVSLREGLPYEVVEKIWRAQWKILRDKIKEGNRLEPLTMPEVFVRGCGRFKPVDGVISKVNKAREARNGTKG
jgi:hypothetical protein